MTAHAHCKRREKISSCFPLETRTCPHSTLSSSTLSTALKPGARTIHRGWREELRQAIADIETGASGKITSIDQIVVHPGGTNAIYTTLSCLLNEEDDIVIPAPMYVGYQGLLGALGANVVHVPLDTANNFALDVEAVKRLSPLIHVFCLSTRLATPVATLFLRRNCVNSRLSAWNAMHG